MATFPNIKIDADSTYTRQMRDLNSDFGDGYSQIVGDGINPYNEIWSLKFTSRPKADVATIASFLDTKRSAIPFTWTPPDEVTPKRWRMTRDGYRVNDAEADTRSISFVIERYFGP